MSISSVWIQSIENYGIIMGESIVSCAQKKIIETCLDLDRHESYELDALDKKVSGG